VIAAIGLGWYARPEVNEERRDRLLPPLLNAAQRATNSIRYRCEAALAVLLTRPGSRIGPMTH